MKKGFTLVEILVSTAILGIIMAGLVMVLIVADKTYNTDMGLLDLQQQARQAMDGMVREIRRAKEETDRPIGVSSDSITFYILTYPGINYSRDTGNRIIRTYPAGSTNPGDQRVLANNIGALTFCWRHGATCDSNRSDSNTIEIRLSANNTIRQRELRFPPSRYPGDVNFLTEKVRLRNE